MTIRMEPYTPAYSPYFTKLNVAWVEHYFSLEEADKRVLFHPQEEVIDKGGHIYFALANDQVAGTFALLPYEKDVMELSKMTVDEAFRGQKIARRMLQFCLEEARRLQLKKVILFSNKILEPAIHLYQDIGFSEVPLGSSVYSRSDIRMEIEIAPNHE